MTPQELKNTVPIFRDGNIYILDDGVEHCIMFGEEELFIKQSIKEIFKKIRPETVIEFGFGLGFTAQQFQDEGVSLHFIYEPNIIIYKRAVAWAENKSGVFIINDRFQDFAMGFKADLLYNDIYGMCDENYSMTSYKEIANSFYFYWYAEFCVDYPGDIFEVPKEYIRFKIAGHDKIQLLIKQ